MEEKRVMQLYEQYGEANFPELEFATVKDFADSLEYMPELCIQQDLKDVERPWAVKAIIDKVPKGGKLLEVGGGEPIVADFLHQLGYDVTLIDPFEGAGNGPIRYEHYKRKYPNVKMIRSYFTDDCDDLTENTFDCIFSISVLEHIPTSEIPSIFRGIEKYSKPGAYTIHNVDHIHLGHEADWSLQHLNSILAQLSLLDEWTLLQGTIDWDPDIFFLSPEGHLLWKGQRAYGEFPFRRCVAVNICKQVQESTALSSSLNKASAKA